MSTRNPKTRQAQRQAEKQERQSERERGYQVLQPARGGCIKAWTLGVPFENAARRQLENVASLPIVHGHIAAMPDVHFGRGATVGSVIPTLGAIIPAAVGVDIGCGMVAQRTTLLASELPDSLRELRSEIERAIPHGSKGGPDPDMSVGGFGVVGVLNFGSPHE